MSSSTNQFLRVSPSPGKNCPKDQPIKRDSAADLCKNSSHNSLKNCISSASPIHHGYCVPEVLSTSSQSCLPRNSQFVTVRPIPGKNCAKIQSTDRDCAADLCKNSSRSSSKNCNGNASPIIRGDFWIEDCVLRRNKNQT